LKLEFSEHIFEKYSNTKFHENPASGSRVGPCGRGRTEVETDMVKLTVAFSSLANAPKNDHNPGWNGNQTTISYLSSR